MDAAVKVVKADMKVDAKYVSITRQLVTYMAADPQSIPTILNILWVARAGSRFLPWIGLEWGTGQGDG